MKLSKILIAAGAVTLGVIIGIAYMNYMDTDYMNEDEVRAIVTDRYQGDINNVSLSSDDEYFLVSLDDGEYSYEIIIDRAEGIVENISTAENPEYDGEASDNDTQQADNADDQNDDTSADGEETEEPGHISVEEARDIAMDEVGGLFLHSAFNDDVSPSEYLIANLIDGDDEGAIVSVNAVNGTINKVIFLDIEFDEIGDLESFMRQVASSNAQNQNFYIEYDDDDWDDD